MDANQTDCNVNSLPAVGRVNTFSHTQIPIKLFLLLFMAITSFQCINSFRVLKKIQYTQHFMFGSCFLLELKMNFPHNESLERAMMVKRTSWGSRAMKSLQTSAASCNKKNIHFSSKVVENCYIIYQKVNFLF